MSFWVKMKRDPKNSRHYEEQMRKNGLQNLANFKQEVQETYRGEDKRQVLEKIETKCKMDRMELNLIKSRVPRRLLPVFVAYRSGRRFREVVALLLISISPGVYKLLLGIRHALR